MTETTEYIKNPNSNCLEGRRCPRCGSYGPFEIAVQTWALLRDDGTDDPRDSTVEFDEDSSAKCLDCEYEGKFGDFDEARQ